MVYGDADPHREQIARCQHQPVRHATKEIPHLHIGNRFFRTQRAQSRRGGRRRREQTLDRDGVASGRLQIEAAERGDAGRSDARPARLPRDAGNGHALEVEFGRRKVPRDQTNPKPVECYCPSLDRCTREDGQGERAVLDAAGEWSGVVKTLR